MDNRTGNQLEYRIYYKRSPDFAPDTTPPIVTYVSPPTPPDNGAIRIGQNATIRVQYSDNESACTNATLFWKNASASDWSWKNMNNISFWVGSYNNLFEENITENVVTNVTYYINCTNGANLTTSTELRNVVFADNITVQDPYPIYGYTSLYNGQGGAMEFNPLTQVYGRLDPGSVVNVTWWNTSISAWSTTSDLSDGNGQYSVDILNYTDGAVVFVNGTSAGWGNKGYNYTIVDIVGAPGGRRQDVIFGVPYDVRITAPLAGSNQYGGVAFPTTYEIVDRDGMLSPGYFTFTDGLMNITAWTPGGCIYTAPPDVTFDGLTTGAPATPGTFTGNVVAYAPGGVWSLNASEGGPSELNPYLTPWGAFGLYDGSDGFLKDWDNITFTLFVGGFDWNLTQGWNIVSAPQDPVSKGTNGVFDAYDALEICFVITGDAGMEMDARVGGNPTTYVSYSYITSNEAAAFAIDGVHGYWVFVSIPGWWNVHFDAQNYSVAGANTVNLGAGWNLLGFTHNYSTWGNHSGSWPRARNFTDASIDVDLQTGGAAGWKIIATLFNNSGQWYDSYVNTTLFPGIDERNWHWNDAYSTNPGNGYWLWATSAVTVTFDTDY